MFKKILVGYLIANGLVWAAIGVGQYLQRGIDCDFEDNPMETACDLLDESMRAQVGWAKYLIEAVKDLF